MNGSLIEKFWTDFCNNHGISKSSHYEAYSFGDPESADYIADLVKNGIKTATSSALASYPKTERIPQASHRLKLLKLYHLIKLWLNTHIMKAKEIVHMNIGIMHMLSFLMQNLNLLTKFLQILRQLFVKFLNS